MAVSKVILNGTTLMDVTVDTVTSEKLLSGYQATGRDGVKVQGSYVPSTASFTTGSADPTEEAQHITPPSGYDGFSYFDVGAIDSDYVGSNIPQNDSDDLSASGSVITAPAGYYAAAASKAVSAGSATTPATSITATPSLSVNASGLISATVNSSKSVTPTVSAGYVSSGIAGTVTASGSSSLQLDTQAAKTVTPTESTQTAVVGGKYTLGPIKVAAISSNYIGSNIAQNSAADLSASGSVVTVPSGYYAAEATKAISAGAITAVDKSYTPTLGITVTNAGLVKASINEVQTGIYAKVTTGGYLAKNTQGTGTFTISAASSSYQLSTVETTTITPTESSQTAVASGKYTTGIVSVAAIPSDYIGSAIASVEVDEGITTVSGTTATRGEATWSAGIIPSGSIPAATFANSSSDQTQYVDISNTTEAPVLVSGGYLYINKGYTDDLKISLAKLVPDGASADLASGVILSGYAAYDNDGNLVAGNIPTKSSSNVTVSGPTVSVSSGYYASGVTKTIPSGTITATHPYATIGLGTFTLDSTTGLISATRASSNVPFTIKGQTAGYIDTTTSSGGTVTINAASSSYQLSTVSAATITPTESSQVAAASGKYTLGDITVAAVSSDYIGSNIPARSSSNLSASGSIVTAAAGYYANAASKAIAAGTATTPATTITANPGISVNSSTGVITATTASSKSITPTISAGYINTGIAGTVTVSGTTSSALSIQAAATINPTESEQTAVAAGKYTTGIVKVGAISSSYIGSNIAQNSAADVVAAGPTVSIPSGYYGTEVNKTVKTVALNSGIDIPFLATISVNSQTGLITAQQGSTTTTYPVSQSGYVEKTSYDIKVSGSTTSQLPTQASTIITPTESSQTAVASGKYTLGPVTVAAIPSDYIGSNITTLAATTYTPSSATQTIPSGIYLTGVQTIEPVPISVVEHRLVMPEGLIGV